MGERPLIGIVSALHIKMREMAMSFWTDERVEELKQLWAKGLSASKIGGILGAPRNAVLGKAFRIGLKRRESKQNNGGAPKLLPARRQRTSKPMREDHLPKAVNGVAAAGESASSIAAFPVQQATIFPMAPAEPLPTTSPDSSPDNMSGDPAVMQLRTNSCRFPIGDPQRGDFRFCCRTAVESYPYCEEHAAIAYIPKVPQRRSSRAARS
jgi:GcrA cell cycle regulator